MSKRELRRHNVRATLRLAPPTDALEPDEAPHRLYGSRPVAGAEARVAHVEHAAHADGAEEDELGPAARRGGTDAADEEECAEHLVPAGGEWGLAEGEGERGCQMRRGRGRHGRIAITVATDG